LTQEIAFEEAQMRLVLMTIMICAAVGVLASVAPAHPPGRDIEVVDIPDKTKLLNAELLGRYILVHDAEKKANGEACMYVYRYSKARNGAPEILPENLVVSFHCVRIERPKANDLVLTYGVAKDGSFELREIQFAGSLEGHRVP
jgi:hypothetical protein